MTTGRRSLRALVLTLGAVWVITSCGIIDGFLDEDEDKGPAAQAGGSRTGTPNSAAFGPYAPGAGGSAMAGGGAGAAGASGNGSLGSAGSGELPPQPGLNGGLPPGQALNNNRLACDDGDCRQAGGQ